SLYAVWVAPPQASPEPINWDRRSRPELGHYAVSWVMPHGRGLVAFAPVFGHATVRHNQSASRNSEVLIKCRRSRSLAIRYAELSGRSRQQETVPSVAFPAADRVLILNGH